MKQLEPFTLLPLGESSNCKAMYLTIHYDCIGQYLYIAYMTTLRMDLILN